MPFPDVNEPGSSQLPVQAAAAGPQPLVDVLVVWSKVVLGRWLQKAPERIVVEEAEAGGGNFVVPQCDITGYWNGMGENFWLF
jgi:hypothetical protein